jgi:elongation factor G
MGELHLDILVDRMRREFKVEANVGKPQVAYRETIRAPWRRSTTRTRSRPVARVSSPRSRSTFEPIESEDGEMYEFVNKVTGGRVPREYIPSVDQGIQAAMQLGVLAGLPDGGRQGHAARWCRARRRLLGDGVQDRRFHDGFKEAARKAEAVLLEPLMAVEVRTPEEYMGDVIGDINSRRGRSSPWRTRHGVKVIRRPGSALRDVRVRRRPAVQDPGSRGVLDEFDSYAEVPERCRRDHQEDPRRVISTGRNRYRHEQLRRPRRTARPQELSLVPD